MDILEKLNPQQRAAVVAQPGPTLVLAGPGSGKTRVLTHRIAYLVGQLGVAPRAILAVTFTNRAAREMKTRVESLLDGGLRGLNIGTFHSICARLLRRESQHLPVTPEFVIFDDSDQQALVKQVLKELNLNDKQYTPGKLLNKISAAKNELIDADAYAATTYLDEIVKRVYTRYQQLLAVNNAFDFDDLLVQVVRLFDNKPEVLTKYQRLYEHLLVDEFQDTNTVQYTMLKQLAAGHRHLYCVGDPDQSVYRWRGADYRNVRKFEQDYPDAQVLLLEENYRSTQIILDAAMAVIDRHPGRTRKQLFTDRQGGAQVHTHEAYNEQEEAQFVVDTIVELSKKKLYRPGDCAVMYRTNAQSRAMEEQFIRAGLPYRLVGAQRFYGRKEIKDLLAYLRLVHNPADSVSFMRIINTPPRGIGAKSLEQIVAAADRAQISAAALLRDLGLNGPKSEFAAQFTGKTGSALLHLGRLLAEWHDSKRDLSVLDLLDLILNGVNYQEYVDDGSEEGRDRWENVLELRNVAAATPDAGLTEFLEQVSLVADQDTLGEEDEATTLLTLHAAKGLEFPVVFMVGLDEGVLPHQRSFEDPESMHEERRLMYVGMTRAKDQLYLVRAFRRSGWGSSDVAEPSRFLQDIPANLMVGNLERQQSRAETYFKKATRWDTNRDAAHPDAPQPKFRSGQRVRHAQFGDGIVIHSKIIGGEEEVDVAFEAMGLKRLMASLANLELLKG